MVMHLYYKTNALNGGEENRFADVCCFLVDSCPLIRVATFREKYLENEIFFRSGNFVVAQRNFRKDLERQGKVREFENKWLWQADFRKFIYSFQEKEKMYFLMR